MALSINGKGTIPLASVLGTTFTQKLQNAGTSTTYPEGTVFDCSSYKSETITDTITIRRAGITLLFGEGDFTMSAVNRNMFTIEAPNVTIIGVSRSAKDSLSSNGSTRFVMTSTTNTGPAYHVFTKTSSIVGWNSADSLTIMNCDFVGVKSAYTSSGGTVSYSNWGCGGFLLTEGNPDQSGSNLNNLYINEVLINGSTNHGITVYGGMLSKIQNTRVRNAGGHGFYIAGSTTSMSLDTCYASGAHLAGFCLSNSSYSTLNNCASDSNGLGYWMKSSVSITMTSCGAEVCEVRSNIPNNLGISLQSSAGNVVVNDITSDYAGYIKGTSYMFTGGGNITGVSCYSKDPSNRENETTYLSKYSAHILAAGGVQKVNMDNFKRQGIPPVKYKYRLEDCYKIQIDDTIYSFDPLNPSETSNEVAMDMPVADVLDQGSGNIFGDLEDSTSFNGRRALIGDSSENYRIENLQAISRFRLPTFDAHPANPQAGTIYFNTALNKLYMYSGSAWFDTCCATAPTPAPECVFPNGGIQTAAQLYLGSASPHCYFRVGNKIYMYYSDVYYQTDPIVSMFDIETQSLQVLLNSNGVSSYIQPYSAGNVLLSNNITYSSTTNSIYFTGKIQNNASYGALGSTQLLLKFNLSTNLIDANYILTDLSPVEADDIYNILSGARLYIKNNILYLVRVSNTEYTQGDGVAITKHDSSTLTILDSYHASGDMLFDIPNGYESNLEVNQKSLLINNNVIINGYGLYSNPNGSKLTLIDIETGDISYQYYDNTPVISSVPFGVTITPSMNPDTFFVANTLTKSVYEIEYDGLATINTWNFEYAVKNITETQINGKRILFYQKLVSGVGSYFEAYNVTDDVILGTQATPIVGQSINLINGNPTDYIYNLETLTLIQKICAPYTV